MLELDESVDETVKSLIPDDGLRLADWNNEVDNVVMLLVRSWTIGIALKVILFCVGIFILF